MTANYGYPFSNQSLSLNNVDQYLNPKHCSLPKSTSILSVLWLTNGLLSVLVCLDTIRIKLLQFFNFHPKTIHSSSRPNFHPNTMHSDYWSNLHPNTMHSDYWPNFHPNTMHSDYWSNFHPNTIHSRFWSNLHPNTIDYGFYLNFHPLTNWLQFFMRLSSYWW